MNNKNAQKNTGCGAGAKKPGCRPASGKKEGKKEGTGGGTAAQNGNETAAAAADGSDPAGTETTRAAESNQGNLGNHAGADPKAEDAPKMKTPETLKQAGRNKPGEPGDPGATEDPENDPGDPEENPESDPANKPEEDADPAAAELADLRRALARAQGELAASRAGVPPEAAEDAVALALAAGEAGTADTVAEALAAVLGRHPEWKAAPARAGGFVLGSDPALGGPTRQTPADDTAGKKRWNRFNGMR